MFSFKIYKQRNFTAPVTSLAQRFRRLGKLERQEEAKAFLVQFCRETEQDCTYQKRRWGEVARDLKRHGYYEHTPEELTFGARVAWRNHARCIGRLFWEGLEVRDCRAHNEPDAIVERVASHMVDAISCGGIRSMISVFSPIQNGRQAAYIESRQITQYAGYFDAKSGRVLGDRQNVEVTRIATALGFKPKSGPSGFDVLPLILRDSQDRRLIAMLPEKCYQQVDISHPEIDALAELKLRWYAVPCISGMIMTIGGIDYPCAPFNGFYMATEIASRDLADPMRYDILPQVSRAIGDSPQKDGTVLWQDRALTELNRAVLHSYRERGITITDHHSASDNFRRFCQREHASGRQVSADWAWIVPPQASSYCEAFHMPMKDLHSVPNFYWNRSEDGLRLMPFYGDQEQSKVSRRMEEWRRSWKTWSRRP